MLYEFVYLNQPRLAGYAAQVDGGLIAETRTRMTKTGSAGATLGVKILGLKADGSRVSEQAQTLSDAPEAQFQRLLAAANIDPEALGWVEVMDPDADLGQVQGREIISWECDIDIPNISRLVAKDGAGLQFLEVARHFVTAVTDAGLKVGGIDGSNLQPGQAEELQKVKAGADIASRLLEAVNQNRTVVGTDSDTDWKVFGTVSSDYLQVDDIDNERLMIVGKVKRIVPPGQPRRIVDLSRLRNAASAFQPQAVAADPSGPEAGKEHEYLTGPAVELDILAIYR